MNNLDDVETYLKTAPEYEKFQLFMSEFGLAAYKISYQFWNSESARMYPH